MTHVIEGGAVFKGTMVNGQMSGFGTCLWPDGSSYVGMFRNNMKNGTGVYLSATGVHVTGNWVRPSATTASSQSVLPGQQQVAGPWERGHAGRGEV